MSTFGEQNEEHVVGIQKKLQNISTRDELWLQFWQPLLFACRLPLGLGFCGWFGCLSKIVVRLQAPHGLGKSRNLVHLSRDLSLAGHGQKNDELVEILVHHHAPTLLTFFPHSFGRKGGQFLGINRGGR